MTKSIVCAFFIIFILGMMVNEIEGQKQGCNEVLKEVDCGAGSCSALCLQKRKGLGRCVTPKGNDTLKCYCYYPCV
ncbi:PREDICTED: defensin-like protein 141 [Camelina sativa]|uniref:Defensin-like protein 141 n=1 Tax=Camelina sativa TaxID=90675 RepID=A0ABM1RA22_CAMSA|nr:PREDICTED: defensin-like protein 141 [Camelina sativa]